MDNTTRSTHASTRVADARGMRTIIAFAGVPHRTLAMRMGIDPRKLAEIICGNRAASPRFRSGFLAAIGESLDTVLFDPKYPEAGPK